MRAKDFWCRNVLEKDATRMGMKDRFRFVRDEKKMGRCKMDIIFFGNTVDSESVFACDARMIAGEWPTNRIV